MDRDRSDQHGLDETLPSGDHGPSAVTRETDGASSAEPHVPRGTTIGRYTVVDRLGSGTMGLVLAAFDPTLDRKVAIKLVRFDPTGSTSGRQRLLREAQAMAKLQHPNVVTVFEVGTYEDRMFLAMEYVAGSTLSEWIAQPGRRKRDIIAAFAAAGHGLAAAHRAGIVHRDFKPTNVLVDRDGRVRVADFGLATAPAEMEPVPVSRETDPGSLGMTKTGAILGTPAYMSPEQHRGVVADPRADQFSFCVALCEALYDALPFEGQTFLVYQDNVLAGRLRELPRRPDVPAHLARVLARGLSVDPAARYPDLDALLAELMRDHGVRKRRLALIGGAGVVAGMVALVLVRTAGNDDPCAAAAQPIAKVWTPEQRAALEHSFVASGSPTAGASFARVAQMLDQRTAALRTARRDACVATSVRHEQSAQLLDRRIQCVDQRAAATTALIEVLAQQHDADVAMKAIDAVLALPSLDPCADRAALLTDKPQPPAPIRARANELSDKLDRAEAMADAGMWTKELAKLDKLIPEIEQLGHAPLTARAHFLAGDAYLQLDHNEQGIAEMRRAGDAAAAAHDDELGAMAWISLYGAVGYRLGHYDEAKGMEQVTAAAVVRAGDTPDLRSKLESARGLIELGRDEYVAAAQHFTAAADIYTKVRGNYSIAIATELQNAGTALTWAGKYDDARKVLDKALALNLEVFGPLHPNTGHCHHTIGVLLDTMGKPEQALEEFHKSAQISAASYPPDNRHVATDLVSIGLVLGELERADEAVQYQERALAILEKHPEESRQDMNTVIFDLGLAYMNAHRLKDSLATLERALAIAEREQGADSAEASQILGALLAVNDLLGDHVRANEFGQRALAIAEKKFGPEHQRVGRVLGDLAQNAIERKDPKQAMQLINRALAIIELPANEDLAVRYTMLGIRATAELALGQTGAALADARASRDGYLSTEQPIAAAELRLTVADILWKQGGAHRREAIAEVKAAQEVLQAKPKANAELLAKARDWLATHK